jgi:hypothetical protein
LLDPDKLTQTRGDLTTQAKAKNECGLLQKGSKLSTTHCWILTIWRKQEAIWRLRQKQRMNAVFSKRAVEFQLRFREVSQEGQQTNPLLKFLTLWRKQSKARLPKSEPPTRAPRVNKIFLRDNSTPLTCGTEP